MKQTLSERKRNNHVIILSEPTSQNFVENMFISLWEEKILNVAMVTYINKRLHIIGFNPYFGNFYQILNSTNVYYNKLRDLNKYKLNLMLVRTEDFTKVRVYKRNNETFYTGKDGMTITTIIKHCNGDFTVVDLHDLYFLQNPFRPINKNFKVQDKDLIIRKHDADIFFDSMETVLNNSTDVVYPHAKDDYKVILPKAKYKTHNENLMNVIQQGFLYFIIFFVLICPLIWFVFGIIERCLKSSRSFRKIHLFLNIVFNNFRIFLGSSTNNFTSYFVENLFLTFLLFSNLVINSYFQSILSSTLTVSVPEPEIDTIYQLAKSKKVVWSVEALINEVKLNFKATNQTLLPNFMVFPLKINTMLYRDLPKNSCILINEDRLLALNELRPSFHIVRESLIPAYQAFHVSKGSPYYLILEKYVCRIMESGLYNFWKKQNSYAVFLQYAYDIDDEVDTKEGFKALNFSNFQLIFYLFYGGMIISSVVFILEILTKFIKVRLLNKT